MKAYLKKSIVALKEHIKNNLDKIRFNEKEIKEILKEPVSNDRSTRLTEKFNINKNLINENNEAINLQKAMMQYMDNYLNHITISEELDFNEAGKNKSMKVNTKIEAKREDYFDLTIKKAIDFDHRHPYFHDDDFANALLKYFIEIEDYEMCARLSDLSKQNTNKYSS